MSNKINKVIVIGSGPIVIGQAAEFDYAGPQNTVNSFERFMDIVRGQQ